MNRKTHIFRLSYFLNKTVIQSLLFSSLTTKVWISILVLKNLKAGGAFSDDDDEEADGVKHQICMNLSCPQYSGEGDCPLREARRPPMKEEADTETEPEVSLFNPTILQ